MVSFAQNLEQGKVGESLIAQWLMSRGHYIIPVYEKEIDEGKGPRVFGPNGSQIIAPDALVIHCDTYKVCFVECKHKKRFSWYRKEQSWQTGIDLRHWKDYQKLKSVLGYEVYLFFLHQLADPWHKDKAYGCPDECPTGLFYGEVDALKDIGRTAHEHANGMVYWNCQDLVKVAELEEVVKPIPFAQSKVKQLPDPEPAKEQVYYVATSRRRGKNKTAAGQLSIFDQELGGAGKTAAQTTHDRLMQMMQKFKPQ